MQQSLVGKELILKDFATEELALTEAKKWRNPERIGKLKPIGIEFCPRKWNEIAGPNLVRGCCRSIRRPKEEKSKTINKKVGSIVSSAFVWSPLPRPPSPCVAATGAKFRHICKTQWVQDGQRQMSALLRNEDPSIAIACLLPVICHFGLSALKAETGTGRIGGVDVVRQEKAASCRAVWPPLFFYYPLTPFSSIKQTTLLLSSDMKKKNNC